MQSGPKGSVGGETGFRVPAIVLCALALCVTLGVLFHRSFEPGVVHFANDFPVGNAMAHQYSMAEGVTGYWMDLNWLGQGGGVATPGMNSLLQIVLGPIGYSKFIQPAVALFLGLCAWVFFRQAGLSGAASGIGALGAALNMNFLSNACWGLGTRSLMLAAVFLAMAALVSPAIRHWWLRALLAGAGVGLAILEGFDNGAIFSIYVGIFAFFLVLKSGEPSQPVAGKAVRGFATVTVTALFAGFVAYAAIDAVIGTSIKGITVSGDQQMSPQQKWDWATQWSTPKVETLRVVVPGLFGYAMDATRRGDKGGEYWGTTGQQPGWEEHRQGFPRHSGSGEYAGLLVVLLSLWAVYRTLRQEHSPYSIADRRIILFWAVAGAISLLLAWGRHAPLYQILYALPYFSTVRNPMKFMHVLHFALMILAAYGFEGIWRQYMTKPAGAGGPMDGLRRLWSATQSPERAWLLGCIGVALLSLFGVMIYSAGEKGLLEHLKDIGFPPEYATNMAKFSTNEAMLFLLFLIASMGSLALLISGYFSGTRAKWGVILAGVVLFVDLGRANSHYIYQHEYTRRHAPHPALDFLRANTHEYRVSTTIPFGFPDPFDTLMQVYRIEWAQHQFPYYNIPSVDVVQMPREPVDYAMYRGAQGPFVITNAATQVRYWELTSTRYLLSVRGAAGALNEGLDPQRKRFNDAFTFSFREPLSEPYATVSNAAGPFAIVEFTGALPRAGIYSHWTNQTDDAAAIRTLADPAFDPTKTVIVAGEAPAAPTGAATEPVRAVEWLSYAPKRFSIKATASAPSILLVNDRYDAGWRVTVDGAPAEVLRCNFVMRGVAIPTGEHVVDFRYVVDLTPMYVSLAGMMLSLGLCGWVMVMRRKSDGERSDGGK